MKVWVCCLDFGSEGLKPPSAVFTDEEKMRMFMLGAESNYGTVMACYEYDANIPNRMVDEPKKVEI